MCCYIGNVVSFSEDKRHMNGAVVSYNYHIETEAWLDNRYWIIFIKTGQGVFVVNDL